MFFLCWKPTLSPFTPLSDLILGSILCHCALGNSRSSSHYLKHQVIASISTFEAMFPNLLVNVKPFQTESLTSTCLYIHFSKWCINFYLEPFKTYIFLMLKMKSIYGGSLLQVAVGLEKYVLKIDNLPIIFNANCIWNW